MIRVLTIMRLFTRAIIGRSRLVAASLRFQAKTHFYVNLCGNVEAQNIIFELWLRPIMTRVRYPIFFLILDNIFTFNLSQQFLISLFWSFTPRIGFSLKNWLDVTILKLYICKPLYCKTITLGNWTMQWKLWLIDFRLKKADWKNVIGSPMQ